MIVADSCTVVGLIHVIATDNYCAQNIHLCLKELLALTTIRKHLDMTDAAVFVLTYFLAVNDRSARRSYGTVHLRSSNRFAK